MKETRADTRTALLQALGLHAVLFALMFAGLNWTRSNVAEAAHGEVIEADLVDPSALSAAMRNALQREPVQPPPPVEQPVVEPEPQPLPEPIVEPEPPPPVPEPAPVEQERVQRDAPSPDVAKVAKEQDEKRKQPEQVDLDAQKQKALAEIRRQRELAAKERTQAEMRAQQLADARASQTDSSSPASPPRGNPNSRSSTQAAYIVALQDAILRQWTRPESVKLDDVCQVLIRQIPGGEVVSVEIAPSCPYDALGRRSVEAAILKASPLPYAGFEDAFIRDPVLKFRARDAADL